MVQTFRRNEKGLRGRPSQTPKSLDVLPKSEIHPSVFTRRIIAISQDKRNSTFAQTWRIEKFYYSNNEQTIVMGGGKSVGMSHLAVSNQGME